MKANPFLSVSHKSSAIAFVVVVFASYVIYFTTRGISHSLPGSILIIGVGLLYSYIGIFRGPSVTEGDNRLLKVAHISIEILLGSLIIYLGEGTTWLVILPIVGTAVENFSRVWAVIAVMIVWIAQLVPAILLYQTQGLISWAMSFVAADVFVAVFTLITVSEQRARRDLAAANQKLRNYAVKIEELAVVQERNRLAREIHDGLGHYLTAVNIQIKAAQAMINQNPTLASEALDNAQTLTQEALADVRRSISSLREDPATSRPLPELLERLLAEAGAAGIQTSFSLQGIPRPLSSQADFSLYRLTQEALTNVRKHANASRVDLRLAYGEHSVRVEIADDGAGTTLLPGESSGFGLTGIRERVELLGGAFRVQTAPGQGFQIIAEIPA